MYLFHTSESRLESPHLQVCTYHRYAAAAGPNTSSSRSRETQTDSATPAPSDPHPQMSDSRTAL
ncbi:uncharacterized protein LOC113202666 isoform X2 [Frankliniella occidentalis]|uniref:Uncharacterized protein LOC113202666 isoform X2 n=1 Tax=Frankliniella occidentalis TaxID=133901 RepID=A0A9C6UB82_FRAOC|nr:uncharacterized protein LOC113202666 isoform X2 [Frankliniella occidentalis]